MHRDTKQLDSFIQNIMKERKLPGVAVSVQGPDGIWFEKGYGYRDLSAATPPDEHTIFGIASMGKSMAALACCILAAEGRMSLDDPVNKYVPDFRVPGNPPDTVCVRHLGMHTTGIPPMEPLEWSIAVNTPDRRSDWDLKMQASAPNSMSTIEQIIDYIAHCPYPTLGAAGEYMSYSNEGYAVLCYVVDAAAGIPLEQFLDERIFTPLGMTRSTLDVDGSRARAMADGNITALFEIGEDGEPQGDEQWSILPPFRACACVKSTAHDMARYYRCLANAGELDGEQVLPKEAVELMIGAGFAEQIKPVYCMGLNKRVEDGHIFCEHSGGLHGVTSEGALLKGEDIGFAVLCNEGETDVTEILWALYNWVLAKPLDKPHRWLFPTEEPFSEPQALVGDYICHEGVPVIASVYIKDNGLHATKDDKEYTLCHCGQGWFLLMDTENRIQGRMHFHIRDGKAWGVQVYTRVYLRIDEDKK